MFLQIIYSLGILILGGGLCSLNCLVAIVAIMISAINVVVTLFAVIVCIDVDCCVDVIVTMR